MIGHAAHVVARTDKIAALWKAQDEGRRADAVRLRAELVEMDRKRAEARKAQYGRVAGR